MGISLKAGSKRQPEPEINVTPLVDIVLVLLIIFMVVTPAMNEGEHIELPKLFAVDEKPADMTPFELTMAENGRMLLDKRVIESASLEAELKKLHEGDPERHLRLNGDKRLPYHVMRETFAKVQNVGFLGVSIKVEEQKAN